MIRYVDASSLEGPDWTWFRKIRTSCKSELSWIFGCVWNSYPKLSMVFINCLITKRASKSLGSYTSLSFTEYYIKAPQRLHTISLERMPASREKVPIRNEELGVPGLSPSPSQDHSICASRKTARQTHWGKLKYTLGKGKVHRPSEEGCFTSYMGFYGSLFLR